MRKRQFNNNCLGFNIPLSIMDKTTRGKISEEIENENIISHRNLTTSIEYPIQQQKDIHSS